MNSRKINFNRRKQRIGNLVTGLLNHFDESSIENLTQDVSIWSNQSMDYVGSAVRRTLRNGVGQGFLVQTGKKTFKLPSQRYETDAEFQTNNYKMCKNRYDDAYVHSRHKHGAKRCRAKDIIHHGQCMLAMTDGEYLCPFHTAVDQILEYRIHFMQNFNDRKFRDTIKRTASDKTKDYLKQLGAIDSYSRSVYREHLVRFFRRYKAFILSENNDPFWISGRPPVREGAGELPKVGGCLASVPKSRNLQCVALNLSNGCRCLNEIDKREEEMNVPLGLKGICSEHRYISLALKGFTRYPGAKTPSDSFFDQQIQHEIQQRTGFQMEDKACVTNYMLTYFRYEFLLITGKPYLTPIYHDIIMTNVNSAHVMAKTPTRGSCFCMTEDELDKTFKRFPRVHVKTHPTTAAKRRSNPNDISNATKTKSGAGKHKPNNRGAAKKSKR